ncbi:MAG TPA: ABC transporter substrate-binding protein [Gemmatimonadales bacterium]
MPRVCFAPRAASIALAGVVAVLGCDRTPPVAVIGYAFPPVGRPAVEVAQDELAEWPPDGPDIRIVFDSIVPGDPADVEVERAERFSLVPDLVGIVGHGGSRGSLAAAPVYNQMGIPQIVPIGTSRLLKNAGAWTFMLAPDDSAEGAFIGEFTVERLAARRVIIFYVDDEYGTGLRDGVVAELRERRTALIAEVAIGFGSDFPTLVDAALIRGRPDVVISAARWLETAKIARLMWDRLGPVAVVAGDGAGQTALLANEAGPVADSVYVVAFWHPDAADSLSRAFVARFERVIGQVPNSADAMSHDALMVLSRAIRTVGPSRAAIQRFLMDLGRNRPALAGITGLISFAPDRRPRLFMTQIRQGQAILIGSN